MSFIGKNIKKIRTVKKLSQAAFAELFNLARPSVGAYEEGRAEPKIDTILAMASHFGLSTDALLRKELTVNELYSLDILKGEFDPTQMPPALGKSSRPEQPTGKGMAGTAPLAPAGIPLVGQESALEYIINVDKRDFITKLPTIALPAEGKEEKRAFEYSGQEMYHHESGLRQGDILLCHLLKKREIVSLEAENIYLFVTPQRLVTRRLQQADKKGVDLKADNPAFDTIHLPAAEILECWEVKGVWSTHLSPPAHLESRMLLLESRLESLESKLSMLQK
jgi:transcriptional regulator with XRE-family HTH domain